MAIEVVAWNIQDGLSKQDKATQITDSLLRFDADLIMVAEAASDDTRGRDSIAAASERFVQHGYQSTSHPYNDSDNRIDRHIWLALTREGVGDKPKAISLNSRTAAEIEFTDPETGKEANFYGVHLDDRSETMRHRQVARLLRRSGISDAIIAGDFNAMHKDDARARALRLSGIVARRLPTIEPGLYHTLSSTEKRKYTLHRVGSLATRLVEMADGNTMLRLTDAGYEDADPERQPTKGPVQIDHIMHTSDILVVKNTVVDESGLSDHRAITATLSVQ